jgi:hypothetical protein
MRRVAFDEFAATDFADEFAVLRRDFASHGNHTRPAFDFPTFKRAVVEVHQLRLLRDLAAIVGIVDHEVRVAADGDLAFAREQAEKFRRLRAAAIDEGIEVEPALAHAVGVEQVDAFFQ